MQNANILYDFLTTEQTHTNVKPSTRLSYIKVICLFNRYLSYKDFKITKNDILGYLNSLKRSESDDPTHKWINTYNTRQAIFSKFFRWLYNQEESDHKKKKNTCLYEWYKATCEKRNIFIQTFRHLNQ